MSLSHCLYQSRCSGTIGETGLRDVLRQARENNLRAGVTGALLFDGERFVQLVEGPADQIEALANKLWADPRHRAFVVVGRGPIGATRHRRWISGFVEPEAIDRFEQTAATADGAVAVLDAFDALLAQADTE